jgi:hypothetical protein
VARELMATMAKVPHHGSVDVGDPAAWRLVVAADATLAITRFNKAEQSLPTQADCARLVARGGCWGETTPLAGSAPEIASPDDSHEAPS